MHDTNDSKPHQWLNPMRRRGVETLIQYGLWHGCKFPLNGEHYMRLRDEHRMEPYRVDGAASDGFTLGAFDVHLAGDVPIVTLLVRSLDELEVPPPFDPERHSPGFRPNPLTRWEAAKLRQQAPFITSKVRTGRLK